MSIIYIETPPDTVPCLYCSKQCNKDMSKDICYTQEYYCNNHYPLIVMFRCVQHITNPPNWFFNTVRITFNNLRLDYNFHANIWLEKFIPAEDHKWGSHWKEIDINVQDISIFDPIKKIASYLNLFKVWS